MQQDFASNYIPTSSSYEIYHRLEDDESRKIFLLRYQYFKTRNIYDLKGIRQHTMQRIKDQTNNFAEYNLETLDFLNNSKLAGINRLEYEEIIQYFPPDIIKPITNEVYVDCGSFDGGTILIFREFAKLGYKHIYGFEPDTLSFKIATNTMKDYSVLNVTLFNKGLWSSNDNTVRFFYTGGHNNSRISIKNDIWNTNIETDTMDKIIDPNDKVTLIKMDVEGSELNALYGARHTILHDKPRLAISIYHKPEDIIEIPSYIISLNPKYKLYMRHHSPVCDEFETVFYAV